MEVQYTDPKILLDRERIEKIVDGHKLEEYPTKQIIKEVLHDLGLGRYKIYEGKSTVCLEMPDRDLRLHIRSCDISTHNRIRGEIPYKDQAVNWINNAVLAIVMDFLPPAQIPQSLFGLSSQSPVTVQNMCIPYKFEHVLRGYMAESNTDTSLYYHYVILGKREFCGYTFPDGMVINQKLDRVYDTPSTKDGHDISVPRQYLYDHGIISREVYEDYILPRSLQAYAAVAEFLARRNIILVDTKLEFGMNKNTNEICVMDEVFTMDSSRFWRMGENGEPLLGNDDKPVSYSKQFARDLAKDAHDFTPDEIREIAIRYIESAQHITGELFVPFDGSYYDIVKKDIKTVLEKI